MVKEGENRTPKRKWGIVRVAVFAVTIPAVLALFFANLARWVPPDSYSVFALFGLAYFQILLLNIALLLYWLFFSRRVALLILVVILLGFQNLITSAHFGGNSQASGSDLRVMTFNARSLTNMMGKKRGISNVDSIETLVKGFRPDIFCLQEFSNLNGQNTSFLDAFCNEIGMERYHFQKYYPKKSSGDMMAIVTISRYPIINREKIEMGGRRIGMFSDIVYRKDTVRVFNLHLQSIRLSNSEIAAIYAIQHGETASENAESPIFSLLTKLKYAFINRAKQSRKVHAVIEKSPFPVIVCGDFNDTPASYAYRKISSRLLDSFVQEGQGQGNTYNGNLPDIRIDYVLHSSDFSTHSYRVVKRKLSDHYPVMVGLNLE